MDITQSSHLPDNLDDAGNNLDIWPQPCLAFHRTFGQFVWLDQFQNPMDSSEPVDEEDHKDEG